MGGLAALNPCTNVQWMKACIHCVHYAVFYFKSSLKLRFVSSRNKKSIFLRKMLSSEWSRRGGLAALNPCTNVQWIKKLHRNPMLSFFAFPNSRTSPRLCPQKKPLQRSSFLIRVESEGFEPSSKQWEFKLSTCLFPDWFSIRDWTGTPGHGLSH